MLPKIDLPTYELTVPSTQQKIKIRPFTVKEEKLLLMAAESQDVNDVINNTVQVLNNCVLEEDFDVSKLPYFDVDYLFIGLRAKSVAENIEVKFTCNNETESGRCGNIFSATVDITNVSLVDSRDNMIIEIGAGKKVIMKYPTYAVIKRLSENQNDIDKKLHLIASCIEQIIDKETVYTSKDYTLLDMVGFIEGMTEKTFRKLEEFVDNLPTFAVIVDANCDKCKFKHKLRYTDFERFFI